MSNIWLRAHFPPKTLWFGAKSAFLSQKSWFHAISRLFSFPTILICKKWSKYNFTATAKFRRNRFSYSNTPKHVQNWLFLGIFSFFLFLRSIFWELWTQNLLFYSSNVGWNIPNDRFMPQVYKKTELSNLTKNEIVLPPKHGALPNRVCSSECCFWTSVLLTSQSITASICCPRLCWCHPLLISEDWKISFLVLLFCCFGLILGNFSQDFQSDFW